MSHQRNFTGFTSSMHMTSTMNGMSMIPTYTHMTYHNNCQYFNSLNKQPNYHTQLAVNSLNNTINKLNKKYKKQNNINIKLDKQEPKDAIDEINILNDKLLRNKIDSNKKIIKLRNSLLNLYTNNVVYGKYYLVYNVSKGLYIIKSYNFQ
mmetsp:Transcript_13733/g.16923  ORF Transcript_13733/g.16923 Transcript_13733/m.16923 type:complete len:150 (+) Transcript_13733:26-475(+)